MKKQKWGITVLLCFNIIFFWGCSQSHSDATHEHEESHDHGDLELSEKQMKTVGIELGPLTQKEIGTGLKVNGVLSVLPEHTSDVSPLLSGIIRNINVAEGQYVKAGSVVATIENLDIVTYQRDYREAEYALKLAEDELRRQETLAREGAGVKKNLERAKTEYELAQTRVKALENQMRLAGINIQHIKEGEMSGKAEVRAPISGIVNKIYAKKGGMADISGPLMTITDNSKVFALLTVYERDLPKIERGQKVDLKLINGVGEMEGVITEINKTVDPDTKGIDIRVSLSGCDNAGDLIPGMAVTGYINSGNTLADVLPEDAVISKGGRHYIFVLENEGDENGEKVYHFERIEVAIGNRQNGYLEITPLSELEVGTQVVKSKAFYLSSMMEDHGEHNH